MTRHICVTALFCAATLCAAGCGGRPTPQAAAAPPAGSVTDDTVVLSSESPMLKQLHRERAAVRDLPTDEIVAPGKIEVNPNRVSKVVLPVTGRVVTVLVKTGDAVKKDQPLLTIQSPDADSAMSAFLSARAAEGQADVALGKAQADADRAADLFEHNAVAKKDVQAADSALAQAKAAVEQARASREQSARRLAVLGLSSNGFDQQVVVRAPLSGKVLELSVVPGEFRNDTTAPVMTIADLSTVWVGSQVPESYIRFVQLGERVEISLVAFPGQMFEGRVSRIADTVDPATRTVKVQAELDNTRGLLRPEMFGSIHHIESTKPTTVIPAGAVIQSGDRSTVFVETTPGRFVQRKVTVGPRAGELVRVVSGVSPGDVVVTDGAMLLQGLLRRS
jgi:cobalt-zinc-cadmium efflux system membrane fusion protein